MDDNFGLGYAMGQDSNSGGFGNGGDGLLWIILILALSGGYGFGGGFGGGGFMNGALTRAELYDGFAMQNIDSAVRGVQQGICDSTYALNNAITGGFNSVNQGICNLGYNVQGGFNEIAHQISDCCCTTQRGIDSINFNTSRELCALGNNIQNGFRDVIDNDNRNYRGIMDFMVQEKLTSKDAQIAQLQNQLSQANQNAVIGARIDAAVAELLRRTGNDCPTAAYLVQPPTPVNFPTNGCGTVQFGGYGNGCGCGGF